MTRNHLRDAVVGAIETAMAPYSPGAATLELEGEPDDWLWVVRVLPRAKGAADFTVSLATPSEDEVVLEFGRTHFFVIEDEPAELLRWVKRYCSAVAAGRFIEAGPKKDSYVRIWDEDGVEWGAGGVHLPWPWRWRGTRTYAPYGPHE